LRNWNAITVVTVNPERDSVITVAQNGDQKSTGRRVTQAATTLTRTGSRQALSLRRCRPIFSIAPLQC